MNPPACGHPTDSLSVYEKEGTALGILSPKHGDHHQPIGHYGQRLDPVTQKYPSSLKPSWPLSTLLRLLRKSSWDLLSTPHATVLTNSHHTQHFSASHLTSNGVLSLAALHITLLHCNNLNPATLLSPMKYPTTA